MSFVLRSGRRSKFRQTPNRLQRSGHVTVPYCASFLSWRDFNGYWPAKYILITYRQQRPSGRRRLRDPDVLLPPFGNKSHAPDLAITSVVVTSSVAAAQSASGRAIAGGSGIAATAFEFPC